MQQTTYILLIIALLFGSIYLGFKCLDWVVKYRASKYQTNLAHFLSDLYKLKIKWSDVGEFGFVGSIDNVIKFHGNIDPIPKAGGVGQPLTNDAASTDIQLKNRRKEELRETMDEWINEY